MYEHTKKSRVCVCSGDLKKKRKKRAEHRARNIAGAEALAVARRPEVASREKNPAAAGMRRFFPLSKTSIEKILALVFFNTHTHRTSTQHTHKKNRPSLWVGI